MIENNCQYGKIPSLTLEQTQNDCKVCRYAGCSHFYCGIDMC